MDVYAWHALLRWAYQPLHWSSQPELSSENISSCYVCIAVSKERCVLELADIYGGFWDTFLSGADTCPDLLARPPGC
jgi:hypothetical protein